MKNQVERFVRTSWLRRPSSMALIAALIAVGIIAAARGLGSQIGDTFNTVTTTMNWAVTFRRRMPTGWGPFAVPTSAERADGLAGCVRRHAAARSFGCDVRGSSPDGLAGRRRLRSGDGPAHHEDPQSDLGADGAGILSAGAAGGARRLDHCRSRVGRRADAGAGRAPVHPRLVRGRRRQADGGHRAVDRRRTTSWPTCSTSRWPAA